MKNAIFAAIGFVALGLFIALFQKRRRDEEIPRIQEDLPNVGNAPTDDDVKRLVEAGRQIDAIKLYRRIHGTGLKEAKDAVDKIPRG